MIIPITTDKGPVVIGIGTIDKPNLVFATNTFDLHVRENTLTASIFTIKAELLLPIWVRKTL